MEITSMEVTRTKEMGKGIRASVEFTAKKQPGCFSPLSFRLTNYRAEEHQNFQGVTHHT